MIEPLSLTLVDRFFTIEPPGKPKTSKLLCVNLAFEHIYSKGFMDKIFSENVKDYIIM